MTEFMRNVLDDIISEVEENDRANIKLSNVYFPIYLEDSELQILTDYFKRHGYYCHEMRHTYMTVIKKD